jgi:hypothetical protein
MSPSHYESVTITTAERTTVVDAVDGLGFDCTVTSHDASRGLGQ